MQYQNPPPTVIGWSIPEDLGNGFVGPLAYATDDIICHVGATPAGTHANVKAGDAVTLQWTPWSHRGAVVDYLANCNGPCETVDKTKLKFFKIDGVGIIEGTTWATDVSQWFLLWLCPCVGANRPILRNSSRTTVAGL